MSPTPFWHRRSKGTCEKQAKPARQRWARIRPQVEQLEDRLAPAVLLWDGGPTANGTDWNTAANWAGDVLPAAADDVRIDAPFSGVTVTHATADTTIRSLTSAASLQIDSGSFAIVSAAGAPASQIDGPLNVIGGALTFDGATLNGPGQLINAATLTITTSTINAPLDNQGTLVNQGSSAINGNFRSDPASTLQLGNQSFGDSVLTFADGFTNRGAIELTESAGRGFSDTLRVSAGTLTNAATGTISSLPGSGGGVRTLAAQLDNQGTLTVEQALTIDKVSAAHTNSGTISVASGQTLTISTGVLTNLNAGTLTGGTYLIAGTFQFPDAAITTNAATIVLDGTDARIVNPPNGNALSALASNLAGASLALRNGASLATQAAVTNAGDLTIDVASKLTITGDYTQTATGTFVAEIGGNPASAQVGRLSTSGQAHLDGTIHVSLVNGFGPLLGQIYIVQTFAGHVGDFATQTGLNLGRVPVFEVGTFATSVRLNVLVDAGDLAADANSIGLPSNGTTGEDVQVTYTVRDTSTTPVPGD
ncbi:MAG TPA: hypothetical protein VEL76_35490, partial [Gemmataceae bacterium]|nr:hypothetical protein [Gemmataceae bacterium]